MRHSILSEMFSVPVIHRKVLLSPSLSEKLDRDTHIGETLLYLTDLTAWFIPHKDPAPGLERAPLPGRGPAPPPPHLRGDRSAVAPGHHLEGENGGVLDRVRPKGLGFCGIPQWHWLLLAMCRLAYGNSVLQKYVHTFAMFITLFIYSDLVLGYA